MTHNIYNTDDLAKHYQSLTKGHWFDKDTMRFFKCRLDGQVFAGKELFFFVSSEKGPDEVRKYTVRSYDPQTGTIDSVEGFQAYKTLVTAKKYAEKEAKK